MLVKIAKIKRALKLRALYKNWVLTIVDRFLNRPTIAVECGDGSLNYIERNTYDRILSLLDKGVVTRCVGNLLELKVGGRTHVVPFREFDTTDKIDPVLRALASGWIYRGGLWEKGDVRFAHMYWPIIETFEEGQYDVVDARGKQVVDVGAFVGDSAIYFALKGAERVYAIEPHPVAYRELVENVRLNRLSDRVVLINVGITYLGDRVAVTYLDDGDVERASNSFYGAGEFGVTVPGRTLARLVEEYRIRPDVLKMDCEGCEYDVILRDYATVSRFEQIIFEHHAYSTGIPASRLLEVLSRWFSCEPVNDHLFMADPKWSREKVGDYYCVKRK